MLCLFVYPDVYGKPVTGTKRVTHEPETVQVFPLGITMNKNVTLTMGHCPHRKYIPELMSMVSTGMVDPTQILTQHATLTSALDAYKAFDEREDGWVKVELVPTKMA